TTGTTAGAKIRGNATINTGLGGAPTNGFDYGALVKLVNLSFAGTVTSITGSPGSSTEFLDTRNQSFAGTLSITNFYGAVLGDNSGTGPTLANNIYVNNSQKNTETDVSAPQGPGNLFNLLGNSKISGSFTYTGGPGRDDVGFLGGAGAGSSASVGG